MTKIRKMILPVVLVAFFAVFTLAITAGCSSDQNANNSNVSTEAENGEWSNVVAGTAGDISVTEGEVIDFVSQYRTVQNYEDDAAFATFLSNSGLTPETFRENVINSLAQQKAVEKKAEELGLSVSDDEVQSQIDEMKQMYGYDDDGWTEFLTNAGYTEDSYKKEIKSSLLQDKLLDQEVSKPEADSTQIQATANGKPDDYTGKKSYNIVFNVEDTTDTAAMDAAKQAAQEAIDNLMADGAVSEEEINALGTQLVDEGTAGQASDVGWDNLTTFVDEYQTALDALAPGELTQEPVQSTYGYHIILCTGEFDTNESGGVDITSMPQEIYDQLKSDTEDSLLSEEQEEYLDNLQAEVKVKIVDAPSGLPYFVDMSLANTNTNGNTNANTNNAATTSATVTSDSGTSVSVADGNGQVTTSEDGSTVLELSGDE